MGTFELVVGIILLVFSVFLVVAVLMQEGKSHNLSGTIAGGADTFFGKSKGQAVSKKLSVLTSVVSIIFVLLVVAVYVVSAKPSKDNQSFWDMLFGGNDTKIEETVDTKTADDTEAAPESEEAGETEAAPESEEAADSAEVTEA